MCICVFVSRYDLLIEWMSSYISMSNKKKIKHKCPKTLFHYDWCSDHSVSLSEVLSFNQLFLDWEQWLPWVSAGWHGNYSEIFKGQNWERNQSSLTLEFKLAAVYFYAHFGYLSLQCSLWFYFPVTLSPASQWQPFRHLVPRRHDNCWSCLTIVTQNHKCCSVFSLLSTLSR